MLAYLLRQKEQIILIVELLEKTNNIKRSAYVWNAINAMFSAFQCPVVLMFITRISGMHDAGVFSIAFAVSNLLLYIGLYGLRRFQASDIDENSPTTTGCALSPAAR